MTTAIFNNFCAAMPPSGLDATSERMIYKLASQWAVKQPVTVLQAMVILPEISTTTSHRRLKLLRKDGWIELSPDDTDNRIKYVGPTPKAKTYFARLGAAMRVAVGGAA